MDSEEKSRENRDQIAMSNNGASTGTMVNQKHLDEIAQTEKEKKRFRWDFNPFPGGDGGSSSGVGAEGLGSLLLAVGWTVGVLLFLEYIEYSL